MKNLIKNIITRIRALFIHKKTQKYALLMVGKTRVWMTESELINAIRISFRDEKQKGFQFSFVIQDMTDEALEHEKIYDIK